MQPILNYYNQHAQAEAQGMAVDWRKVANTLANMVAAEMQPAKPAAPDTPAPLPEPPI